MRVHTCAVAFCIIALLLLNACGTSVQPPVQSVSLPTVTTYPAPVPNPKSPSLILPTSQAAELQVAYPAPLIYPSSTPVYNPAGTTASQTITATLTPLSQVRSWEKYPPPWPNDGFQFFTVNDGLGAGQVGNQRALLETHDGGRSWQYLGPLPLECTNGGMQFLTPTDGWGWGYPLKVFDAPATLCRTEDGGKTWTPLSQLPNEMYRTVSVVNAQTLYVSGVQQPLLVSYDGGLTLAPVTSDEQNGGQAQFVSQTHGWSFRDAQLFVTTDGGQTWQAVSLGYQIYGFYAVSEQQVWVYVGDCDGQFCKPLLVSTDDGGATWIRYLIETPSSLNYLTALHRFSFVDSQHGWLYHGSNTLWSTSDGGLTWQQLQ